MTLSDSRVAKHVLRKRALTGLLQHIVQISKSREANQFVHKLRPRLAALHF
jgi:hypothetical protein